MLGPTNASGEYTLSHDFAAFDKQTSLQTRRPPFGLSNHGRVSDPIRRPIRLNFLHSSKRRFRSQLFLFFLPEPREYLQMSNQPTRQVLDVEDDDARQQRIRMFYHPECSPPCFTLFRAGALLEHTDAAIAPRRARPFPTLPPSRPHPVPLSDRKSLSLS